MKQTSNAIKFLMAQYRAIFKRAFLSNLGLALTAAAGLAAGTANADDKLTHDILSQDPSKDYIAYGIHDDKDNQYNELAISGSVTNFTGKITVAGGHFSLSSDSTPFSSGNYIMNGTLSGSGTLVVDTKREYTVPDDTTHQGGLTIVASGSSVNVDLGSILVDSGTLNIFAVSSGDKAIVTAKEIKIDGKPGGTLPNGKNDVGRAVVQVGSNGTADSGNVTFGSEYSTILLTGAQGRLNINGTNSASGSKVSAKEISITDGAALQAIVKDGASGSITAHQIKMSGGEFNVDTASSGSFNLKLDAVQNTDKTFTSGLFDAQSGTLRFNSKMTLTQGTIAVGEDTKLISTKPDKGSAQTERGLVINAGIASFDQTKLADAFNAEKMTSLKVSADKLEGLLEGTAKDSTQKASVMLTSGGVLEFTTAVDLADFDYNSGSSLSEGNLVVSGGGVITAQDMTVSKQLDSGSGPITGLSLHLKADNLTLGDANYDSAAGNKLGFASATAKNVSFVAQNNEFAFKDTLTLANTRTIKDQNGKDLVVGESGSISGDVKLVNDGSITVNGGHYEADGISLSGGTVSIFNTTNNTKGIQSSLTIEDLSFGDATTGSTITVSGKGSQLTVNDITYNTAAGSQNSGTITATSGGIVNLDNGDVQAALNDIADNKGNINARFLATHGGELHIQDGGLELNFTEANKNALALALKYNEGKGKLFVSDLSINAKEVSDLGYLGGGELHVANLNLNAYDASNNVQANATLSLNQGYYYISNSLNSRNDLVRLYSDNADIKSSLYLGSAEAVYDADGKEKYYKDPTQSGQINTNLEVSKNGIMNVEFGNWQAKKLTVSENGSVTVGNGTYKDVDGKLFNASLSGSDLTMTSGKFTVNTNGSATFNTIDTSSASTDALTIQGKFNLVGGTAETDKIALGNGSVLVQRNGELTLGKAALDNSFFEETATNLAVKDAVKDGIKIDVNGKVKLGYSAADKRTFTIDQLNSIKTGLFANDKDGKIEGVLDIGAAKIDNIDVVNGEISWDTLGKVSDIDFVNDELKNATVTDVSGDFRAHVGSVQTKGSDLTVAGHSSLNNAKDGKFVTDANGKLVGVTVKNGSDLELNGSGAIGKVSLSDSGSSLTTAGDGVITVDSISGTGDLYAESNTDVKGEVNVKNAIVSNKLSIGDKATFETLSSAADSASSLTVTKDLTVKSDANFTGDIKVEGKTEFGADAFLAGNNQLKKVDFKQDAELSKGATTATEVNLVNGGSLELTDSASLTADVIQVKGGSNSMTIKVGAQEVEGVREASAGYLTANRVDLTQGSYLIADPDYGNASSIVAINTLGKANEAKDNAGVARGQIVAARNSIIALGVADGDTKAIDQVKSTFAKYFDANGSLDADGVGAVLYVAKAVTVANNAKIVVDSTVGTTDYLKVDGKQSKITSDAYIGSNSVLAIDEVASGNQKQAAIQFESSDASLFAETGAKIVLTGSQISNANNLFNDANDDGIKVTTEDGEDLIVESLNGLYHGSIANGDTVKGTTNLSFNTKAARNMYAGRVSNSTAHTLIAYGANDLDWENANKAGHIEQFIHNGVNPDVTYDGSNFKDSTGKILDPKMFELVDHGNGKYTVYNARGNSFLRDDSANHDGTSTETATRLGSYGGAVHAAMQAGASTYNAISGHMGIGGSQFEITSANNSQGSSLWVSPIYNSLDSDGLSTGGLTYGADVDLYGLALGGDYTMSNGLRFGAVFNVGAGDADGNGGGAGVSNDFNYYGFGIYGGYSMNNFSVLADLSYTVVDNDVDANTALDKLTTSFDTTALSLGVTGQYALDLGNQFVVTPHAGLRFTRLDMDDYTIKGTSYGEIAKFDGDSINVFSVPVGITFAKEFQGEAWTVKPSFDLTLTGNFGDDEIEGLVKWNEVQNLTTAATAEVLDSFTYGATVGVSATNGNFSFGAGLNYTGSSNTDEFGINATARFLF